MQVVPGMVMDRRKNHLKSHYEPRLEAYDEGYAIHDWESRDTQRLRFDVLIEHASLGGARLLDVGCGVGDLYEYLRCVRGIEVDYVGVDILEAMVGAAKQRHRDAQFYCADLIESNPFEPRSFDVVYCSGTFNLSIEDHEAFAVSMLSVLTTLFRERLVFNMLDTESPDRDSRYCYFDPRQVVEWEVLRPFQPTVVSGYLKNDFTVVCTRPAAEVV